MRDRLGAVAMKVKDISLFLDLDVVFAVESFFLDESTFKMIW